MPKRSRTQAAVENTSPSNEATTAPAGKPGKVINVAYGAVNKAGDAIPVHPIERPNITLPDNKTLRVAAWNLNGMRSFMEKRGDQIRKIWENEHLDVLGINEHKITDETRAGEIEAAVKKVLQGHDVKLVWNMCSTKKGYSGTLALVRADVFKRCISVSFGIDKKSDPEGRIITLEFDSVAILVTYVPNSGMTLDRLAYRTNTWDKELSDYCDSLAKKKQVIVAGDLNVAIRDMDIWNVDAAHIPKLAGTTPQERASFGKQFLKKGFIDAFAYMHPDKTGWFSYWSIKAKNKPKNRGLRLDYVLVDQKCKLLDAYIACQYTVDGDHCPVGVVCEISDKLNL